MTDNKEKIKIITYENFPYGGASANLLRYFALALSREGNDVEVVLPTGNYFGNKIDINIEKKGNIENVTYRHLCFKHHPKNFIGKVIDNLCGIFLPIFFIFKESIKKNLDKIILYNVSFTSILIFLFIKVIVRKKLVIIIPEFYEKPKSKFPKLSLIFWYNFYLGFKYPLKYADGYIVVTNFLKKTIQNDLKSTKNILLLPSLMDPEIFDLKEVKPFVNNKITIGYAGTPTRKDGVIDLIESFKIINEKHPNTHLLIIGDSVDVRNSILPELKTYALNLGIVNNITFTGLVQFNSIPKLLNSCQILTLTRPSGVFAEAGFPTKLGEYFACKKPVVVTSVGDIPFYFKNKEQVIIVEPDNIESIVNGFRLLIENSELSISISNNAFKWMDMNLNFRNVSNKLNEFILSV